jgi:hypothetical protein
MADTHAPHANPQTATTKPKNDGKNLSFDNVLEHELGSIADRRKKLFKDPPFVYDTKARAVDNVHLARPLGVAFSGGGIRSATFNLGLLQGLAERGLLKYADYLSTVSGGGYIGSWLHGVIKTPFGGNPDAASTTLLSPEGHVTPGPPKDDPISFLRKFSNYLAPRAGLFSVDVWVIFLIWVRNVLLNQLILVPALTVPILAAFFMVLLEQIMPVVVWAPLFNGLTALAVLVALAALTVVIVIVAKNLDPVVMQTKGMQPDKKRIDKTWERRSTYVPPLLLAAAYVLGCGSSLAGWGWPARLFTGAGFAVLFALLQAEGGFVSCYQRQHPDTPARAFPHLAWMSLVCGVVTASLVFAVWTTVGRWDPWDKVAFSMPLICLSLIAGVALQIGLMGTDFPDAAREWIARIGSMIALWCLAWTALFILAVRAPQGFAWLIGWHGNTAVGTIATWVITTAAGVLAGRSEHTDGRGASIGRKALDVLVRIAPLVFVAGYLLLLSYAAHAALQAVSPDTAATAPVSEPASRRLTVDVRVPETAPAIEVDVRGPEQKGWLDTALEPATAFARDYTRVFKFVENKANAAQPTTLAAQVDEILMISRWGRPVWVLVFLVVCAVVAWVAGGRININEFSLHHFYKNRLVRCYLGASNTRARKPNFLTGFDPNDDFPIADLTPSKNYLGPYPIVNVALNVNAGAELAQQERKALSFVFTPQYCGFDPSHTDDDAYEVETRKQDLDEFGYRQTKGYSQPAGPRLGTALAISGAAANPNSGYSTSGPMAFLLTVFDARLGWWLGNPRSKTAGKMTGPSFALWYLLSELAGQTTATSSFVNLSDGGHFDNLGLYELVKRRCRFIIIGDGEQDKDLTFGSLGGAIRKCRADFGVEIDIDPTPIRVAGSKEFSQAHCVVGTITYPEDDAGAPISMVGGDAVPCGTRARGWILYVKSSLTGDEPADVIEYRSRFKDFPHQSTADQFFDESQFESYRRLGLHIIRDAFEGIDLAPVVNAGRDPRQLVSVFQALTRKWYAPPPVELGDMSRLNDEYSQLIQRLADTKDLWDLVPVLVLTSANPPQPKLTGEMHMFIVEVIQLMENVYTEFKLEHEMNRANPRNAGWMRVFRRWAQQQVVRDVWDTVKENYNTLFGAFMDQALRKPEEDMPPRN